MAVHEQVKQVAEWLRSGELSVEDRNLLTTTLLDRLGALPVRARILLEKDQLGRVARILVDGKPLTDFNALRLLRSARSLQKSFAFKLIRETTVFMAVKQGVHFNTSPEQGLFAKAILWQRQEEDELVNALAALEHVVPDEL